VGGSRGEPATLPDDWRLQVLAVGAVRGLEIEVLEQPHRRLPDVLRAIRERRPDLVLIWDPYVAGTADRIAAEVGEAAEEEGIIIRIDEAGLEDALLLARLELDALLAHWVVGPPDDGDAAGPVIPSPTAGEERYYRKLYGSAVGDIMRRIEDCGHNQWQSTNKAPRAWKGIERMENATPEHLSRCMRGGCRRWCARF
jgi:hypothetical protein